MSTKRVTYHGDLAEVYVPEAGAFTRGKATPVSEEVAEFLLSSPDFKVDSNEPKKEGESK